MFNNNSNNINNDDNNNNNNINNNINNINNSYDRVVNDSSLSQSQRPITKTRKSAIHCWSPEIR